MSGSLAPSSPHARRVAQELESPSLLSNREKQSNCTLASTAKLYPFSPGSGGEQGSNQELHLCQSAPYIIQP